MCNFIENMKINRALKQKQRDKRVEQACCPHKIVHVGTYNETYSQGYGYRSQQVFQAYCPVCDKDLYYYDKISMQIDLAKQEARDEYHA